MHPSLSRDTLVRLITKPKPEHPERPPAAAPAPAAPIPIIAPPIDRTTGCRCVQMLIAGSYVWMFEMLPDETAGEMLAVPVAEFAAERYEKFERYVRRKQLRKRLHLVR